MPNGQIELTWGDAVQTFNVAPIKYILELEEKCGCGVREILSRISGDRWRANDLRETLRLGLIGGGKTPEQALTLIERYFDDRPMIESARPAFLVLGAAIVGVPGEDVGKKATADRSQAKTPSSETMADSPDPLATVSEQPSDLPRDKSTS